MINTNCSNSEKRSYFVIGTEHLLCSLGTSILISIPSAKNSLFVKNSRGLWQVFIDQIIALNFL